MTDEPLEQRPGHPPAEAKRGRYTLVLASDLRKYDKYGLALMMIREGCIDPREVAAEALREDSEAVK